MSKSLNILAPVIGGCVMVLGVAYGVATRDYRADEAELALARAEAAERRLASAMAEAQAAAQAAASDLQAQQTRPAAGGTPAPQPAGLLGLGRAAQPQEIAAWDVDVRPDGRGLPEGSGNAYDGEPLFEANCASCHGSFAEGVDNWPVLAGGFGTLADEDPVKTVGSYWPYLSTVWDYVHRSMPFGNAQTLSADDTYAIVAYILYSNDLIADDFELSRDSFLEVEMPNAGGFIPDDRAETEYTQWRTDPCMENCKDSVQITMRASVLDVTPQEPGDAAPVVLAAAEPAPGPAVDPALVAAGERVFNKCKSCHQVGEGAKHRTGPHLNALLGRPVGGADGFAYSSAMADHGGVWDADTLAAFLENPKQAIKGTKMAFAGLRKPEEIAAVTAYLATVGAP